MPLPDAAVARQILDVAARIEFDEGFRRAVDADPVAELSQAGLPAWVVDQLVADDAEVVAFSGRALTLAVRAHDCAMAVLRGTDRRLITG